MNCLYSTGKRVTTPNPRLLNVSTNSTKPVDIYFQVNKGPNGEVYTPVGLFFFHPTPGLADGNFPPHLITIDSSGVLKFSDNCITPKGTFDFYVLIQYQNQLGIIDPGIQHDNSHPGLHGGRRHHRRRDR
ncbi:MAG TPA: hypothetical protein VN775_02090, partial [Opitutaceae bacterium]|nr:hypothetical protein [Opitutaceae bacterium]